MGSVVLGASLLFTAGAAEAQAQHDPIRTILTMTGKGRLQARRLLHMEHESMPEEWEKNIDEAMMRALQQEGLAMEILDPRELQYMFTQKKDLASDLKLLQRRQQDLANAPRLAEGNHFPPRAVVSDKLAFNRAYGENLKRRQSVDPARWGDWQEVIQENDRRYQLWDTVRDARCEYYYVTVRRQALERVLERLGSEKFIAADFPPHVPTESFTPSDK